MLDGRGRVRISAFGVAASAHNVQEGEICGTPEYMSPEQLAAERATIQSDLYSLGLLLFQLFTGRRAFSSVEARLSKESTPPDPLETVGDLDPSVGEAIRSCLRPDPGDRPSSAAALLGILAQGNPMRALLGSDNTPPAEVVAAVGGSGSFDRSMAVWLTGIVVLGLLLIMWAADQVMLFRQVDPTLPPEALTQRARDLLRRVGYSGLARDTAFGFGHALSPRSFDWPSQEDPGDTDERSGAGWPNLYFWYRESSEFFRPQDPLSRVSAPDPPFVPFPGAVSVVLDPGGRLWELQITPQLADGNQEDDGRAGWPELFAAAGLAPEEFRPTVPRWIPPVMSDTNRAWQGVATDGSEVRVEAASYAGRPVFFRIEADSHGSILDPPRSKLTPFRFLPQRYVTLEGALVGFPDVLGNDY